MRTHTDTSLSLSLPACLTVGVSMETRREGGTGGGVAMGTDGAASAGAYLARRGSAPCASPPGASCTSPVALCRWPVAVRRRRVIGQRWRGQEVKDTH